MTAQASEIFAEDAARAIATLTLAFAGDPMVRWSWPAADVFLANFPSFVEALAGSSFMHGGAYEIAGMRGIALWMPPGVNPDEEALDRLFERTTTRAQQEHGAKFFALMEAHTPRAPHWHLPLIGIDPLSQGQGLGVQLMAPVLARCDAERVPAYLESSNTRNVPFYERLGFAPVGTIQVGDSPVMTPMLRTPR